MGIMAEAVWIDATRGVGCGESGVYETFAETPGELYRFMQKEYGRCVSRVYIDGPDGKVRAVGWVFQQRRRYDDAPETFLRETWVTLHDAQPTVTTAHHYHDL